MAGRVERRQQQHSDASEATVAVLEQQLHNLQPLADYEQPHVLLVNTSENSAV